MKATQFIVAASEKASEPTLEFAETLLFTLVVPVRLIEVLPERVVGPFTVKAAPVSTEFTTSKVPLLPPVEGLLPTVIVPPIFIFKALEIVLTPYNAIPPVVVNFASVHVRVPVFAISS